MGLHLQYLLPIDAPVFKKQISLDMIHLLIIIFEFLYLMHLLLGVDSKMLSYLQYSCVLNSKIQHCIDSETNWQLEKFFLRNNVFNAWLYIVKVVSYLAFYFKKIYFSSHTVMNQALSLVFFFQWKYLEKHIYMV